MKEINDKRQFEKIWNESPALICDFSATWCGPCKMLEPVLRKLEKENPSIAFVKVDVDEQEELSDMYKIQAMPTILFVKKGKVVKRIVGVEDYQSLSKQVEKLLDKGASR